MSLVCFCPGPFSKQYGLAVSLSANHSHFILNKKPSGRQKTGLVTVNWGRKREGESELIPDGKGRNALMTAMCFL